MYTDDRIHYQILDPQVNSNVKCLNGGAHRKSSEDITKVTCEKCLSNSENSRYWQEKILSLLEVKTGEETIAHVGESIKVIDSNYDSGRLPTCEDHNTGEGRVMSGKYMKWLESKAEVEKLIEKYKSLS